MPPRKMKAGRRNSPPQGGTDPTRVSGDLLPATIHHPESPPQSRPATPIEPEASSKPEPSMPRADEHGGADDLDGLVKAWRSDSKYKMVSDVFNEFLFLKERNNSLNIAHREILDEYRSFRNELEAAKDELAGQKSQLEADVKERDEKIDQLDNDNAKLESSLNETTAALLEEREANEAAAATAAKEIEALQSTLEMKETDLAAVHSTLEEFKEKASAASKAAKEELDAKQATLDERQTELDTTQAALEQEKQNASEAAEAASKDIAEKQEALDGLQADLDATKATLEEEKKIAEKEGEIAAKEIADRQALLEEQQAELDSTKATLEEETKKAAEAAKAAAQEISAKQSAIDDLQAELDTTKSTLEVEKRKAEEAAEAASKEISDLTESLRQREEDITGLTQDLDGERERVAALATNVGDLEDKLQDTQHTLEVTNDRLQGLQRYRIELKSESEDTYVSILDRIWTSIVSLVESTFRQDLDEAVLTDSSCWSNLRTCEYLRHARQIPLPQTNSPAAKGMRIAAVLAVLSRALHKYVFRPVYLVEHDENLTQLLRELEEDDPTWEVHFRSTLLRLLPERQRASSVKRVDAVVREVCWLVQHLLSSLQFDAFRSRLEATCKLACSEWMRIQLAKMKIEPYFGPPFDDFDWQVLELPEFQAPPADTEAGGAPTSDLESSALGKNKAVDGVSEEAEDGDKTNGQPTIDDAASVATHDTSASLEPNEILLVVWPSMCAVEEGDLASITQGLVITKEQARSAMEEVRSRAGRKANSKRARSMSMARPRSGEEGDCDPAGSFLGEAPTATDDGGTGPGPDDG